MRPFGWNKWQSQHREFKRSGRPSLERWGLSYLHSAYALEKMAHAIAHDMSRRGIKSLVSVESIWIDGTPQVKALTHGGQVKCELADLLFILDERDINANPIKQTGLLVQAKTAAKYNKIDAGNSTKKERKLLEDVDRNSPLHVFRDMAGNSAIGSYTLGGSAHGLKDCARYLLMPKNYAWPLIRLGIAPYQVGWPAARTSPLLRSPIGIVQAIQKAAIGGTIGKPIIDPKLCEWSRLVRDLLGNYRGVTMRGYNGQGRVHGSASVMSFMSDDHPLSSIQNYRSLPPFLTNFEEGNESSDPPAISVVKVNIRYLTQSDENFQREA